MISNAAVASDHNQRKHDGGAARMRQPRCAPRCPATSRAADLVRLRNATFQPLAFVEIGSLDVAHSMFSTSRNRPRARCNCALELPTAMPSSAAMSSRPAFHVVQHQHRARPRRQGRDRAFEVHRQRGGVAGGIRNRRAFHRQSSSSPSCVAGAARSNAINAVLTATRCSQGGERGEAIARQRLPRAHERVLRQFLGLPAAPAEQARDDAVHAPGMAPVQGLERRHLARAGAREHVVRVLDGRRGHAGEIGYSSHGGQHSHWDAPGTRRV